MRPLRSCICIIAVALAACSEKPLLSLEDKAKFTAALIAEQSECAAFGRKLAPPVASQQVIEQTYAAAKAAHCLKPDV